MSDSSSALHSRLLRLQSRFTWNLQEDQVDLKNLSTRLQDHIELQLGQRGAAARSCSFLAYVRYLQGRPKEAESLLNQSEEKIRQCYGEASERRLTVVYADLAWLKYHTGDFMESQRYCQRVEDIQSNDPPGSSSDLHPEVYGEKAWTFLKFSKSYYPRAIECFRKALELQPDDSEWTAGCAIALFRTEPKVLETLEEGEESPAVRQLRRALEINPEDGVLLSMLALKLLDYEKVPEAEGLVEKALKTDPENPHIMRYVGKFLRIQGDNKRSVDLLKRALKRTDQSAFIHHQLAMCYKKNKVEEQSRKPFNKHKVKQWRRLCIHHLDEAVSIKPSFVLAIADLALMNAEEKNLSRAQDLFLQGSQKLSETDESIRQVFHLRSAEFHQYHSKQEAEAVAHYKQGLQSVQRTWEWKQCAKRLKQIAERRLSEDENDADALALLGLVSKAEGDKKKAVEFYEKALDCGGNQDQYLSALLDLRMELH